jgi:hypothetical protein
MSAFKSGEIVKNIVPVEGTVVEYRPQDYRYQEERGPLPENTPRGMHEPTIGEGKSGPTPDTEIGATVTIKVGKRGTVMHSDEITTIVFYSFSTTGELEPHGVKAEGFTSDFERVVRGEKPSRGPHFYPDRRIPKENPTQRESKWKVVK